MHDTRHTLREQQSPGLSSEIDSSFSALHAAAQLYTKNAPTSANFPQNKLEFDRKFQEFYDFATKFVHNIASIHLRNSRHQSSADDITQDVLSKFIEPDQVLKFDYSRGLKPSSWIGIIAERRCIDLKRRGSNKVLNLTDIEQQSYDPDIRPSALDSTIDPLSPSPLDALTAHESYRSILQVLNDSGQKEGRVPGGLHSLVDAMLDADLDKRSLAEIRDTLQLPTGTVKTQISRLRSVARERLRAKGLAPDNSSHEGGAA